MTTIHAHRQPDWHLPLAAVLFLLAAMQTYNLVGLLHVSQGYKTDLAEVNHIRYGLLNADEWVQRTSAILEKKIDEFELNDRNKEGLRESVERVIDAAINQIDRIIREKNLQEPSSWWDRLTGHVKQFFTDVLVNIQSLHDHVPEFTGLLFEELNRRFGSGFQMLSYGKQTRSIV